MHISAIHIYPVKGCRGIALDAIQLDEIGPCGDRRFMVVDASGKFLSQRTHPLMALIDTQLSAEGLTLTAPKHTSINILFSQIARNATHLAVEIWKDSNLTADDCGEAAAAWLTSYLGQPVRLVHLGPRFVRPVKPSKARPGDVVSFADAYPLLLISEATLADLNRRLTDQGEAPVPMNRFRPNLVISGCAAFAEDLLPPQTHLRIGDALLRAAGPCARCIVTTTDQETAIRGHEPLRTLAKYRRDSTEPTKINFGQNFIHETKAGLIQIGDVVTPCNGDSSRE